MVRLEHFCELFHLHVHTEKSDFDGLMSMRSIVEKIKREKMRGVAITDHHHLISWNELEYRSRKNDLKPIFGIELNVKPYHMTAMAMNEIGLENIIALNNIGHQKNSIYVNYNDIKKHKEGVFFLTGCSKGKIFNEYYKKGDKGVIKTLEEYKSLFGKNFGIELTTTNIPNNLMQLLYFESQKNNVMIVPTNDCHYLDKRDKEVYLRNIWLKTRGKIPQQHEYRHIKTYNEMSKDFNKEWISNTVKVANKCEASYIQSILKNIKNGVYKIPLCKIVRFNDAESLKMVYMTKKDYKKANQVYKTIIKSDLSLEDLTYKEEFRDVLDYAFGIRGKIKETKPHEKMKIAIDIKKVPILKEKTTGKIYAQLTEQDIQKLNI